MLRLSEVTQHVLHNDFQNKHICFPYQLCRRSLSGSRWWRSSPCQWGLWRWHPCDAALVQPCSGPCWKRQRHTSPERRKQTGFVGEDGRKRSQHHEATSRNRNWKSWNQEKTSLLIVSSSIGYPKYPPCCFLFIYSTSQPGCQESEETNCQVTIQYNTQKRKKPQKVLTCSYLYLFLFF